jgi:hypothetical protein
MLIDHKKAELKPNKRASLPVEAHKKVFFSPGALRSSKLPFPLGFVLIYLSYATYASHIIVSDITVGLYQTSWYRNFKCLMGSGIINEHAIPLRL